MSKEKPKSAMAMALEQGISPDVLSADIGISERETPSTENQITSTPQVNQNTYPDGFLITVDPIDCIPWDFSDRLDDELGDIKELAESMKKNGQQEPALIRKTKGAKKNKYEIIFGNRRWRAAKKADLKLLAILKDISDEDAARSQKEENENRKNISDYSRALNYSKLLENGVFKSETDLCNKLNISKKTMNDIMAFVRVPEILRHSIPNFSEISRVTATKIAKFAKDEATLKILLNLAPLIGSKKANANNIERLVEKGLHHTKQLEISQPVKIIDQKGHGSISIKTKTNGSYTITLNSTHFDLSVIKEHMEALFLKVKS